MASNTYSAPVITGEDFVMMIRRLDDSGTLIDFTGWSASFVGRKRLNDPDALFEYNELNQVELGLFSLNGEDQNIRLTIPFSKTLEFNEAGLSHIHIGLLLSPPASQPNSRPQQVIVNDTVEICKSIA